MQSRVPAHLVPEIRGGATNIKMVRQNRGAAGAEASAEGTRMEAPPSRLGGLGSVVSSPSGVWGGAPAASEFCSFYFPFHAF